MKGVSGDAVYHEAKRRGVSVLELFRALYWGERVSFDLTLEGCKVSFKYERDLSCRRYKAGEFTRALCFGGVRSCRPLTAEEENGALEELVLL